MHKIEVTFPGGKKTAAKMNEHVIMSDQSVRGGGEGTAPSPFDLFLISLASCAGVYAQAFCEQRGIPVDDLKIQFESRVDPENGMVSEIDLKIVTPPGFPEKYEKAIIKAVDQCSVKKHLASPPQIRVATEMV